LDRGEHLGDLDESLDVVLRLLGVSRLRPAQLEVILAALRGESVLFVSATGSGKTLCFQVPVLLRSGCAYVISPLKALMREQIAELQRKKIPGTFINGDLSPDEKKLRYDLLRQKVYRFLFCTPERFDPRLVAVAEVEALSRTTPRWLVVDEVHCIDRWGRDFRPNYGRLGAVRERLGRPQVLAFTATAGKESQERILASLGIPDARVVVTGIDRPNIALARIPLEDDEKRVALIKDLLKAVPHGRVMVFVPTVKIGERLQKYLRAAGVELPFYHSKLGTANERDVLLGRFTGRVHPRTNAVICTNAFGMGLDVPDVRLAVHWQPPSSVEDYLQEFGRAGRDGKPAIAILLTSRDDARLARFMAEKTVEAANLEPARHKELLEAKYRAIARLIAMSTARSGCFREAIAEYFGSARPARPKSWAIRLLEWIFTRESKVARAKGCCDRCDEVLPGNVVTWAIRILENTPNSLLDRVRLTAGSHPRPVQPPA
jgi:ATP-dependent DNA helicase RecQ